MSGRRRAMPLPPEIGEKQVILKRVLARKDQDGQFPLQRLFGNLMESRAKTKTGILGRLAATGETQEPPKVIAVAEDRYRHSSKYVVSV